MRLLKVAGYSSLVIAILVGVGSKAAWSVQDAGEPDGQSTPDSTSADSADGSAGDKEASWTETVDKAFGDYVVAPLTAVLFYDFETSRFIKRTNAWTHEIKTDAKNVIALSIVHGDEIKITINETKDGSTLAPRQIKAANLEELQSTSSEGHDYYQQYATDQYLEGVSIPFVVLWLLGGALFLTVRMGFINFRGFTHSIRVTSGAYDNPDEPGEVTHFQALSSALSATVGLGNIAGVTIAVIRGGPGAIFWMVLCGLLGMTSKFTECSLGQMYRKVDPDGRVSGGPMRYLKDGLSELGGGTGVLPVLGQILAVMFAIMCFGGALGGGNAFQVNQSLTAIRQEIGLIDEFPWIYGAVMAIMVGLVIIGGIKRIGATASKIVPAMCTIYVITSLYILFRNAGQVPDAFARIVGEAFTLKAGIGGLLGVLVTGVTRAAFSNEAGVGSASIAHSAAKTEEPVREGIVALLEPFIDTVVVCTITGLVIVVTGVVDNPEYLTMVTQTEGAALTSAAWGDQVRWFRFVLVLAMFLFAYSTLISWSYYGERCATYLLGPKASLPFKLIYLGCAFGASLVNPTSILDFSNIMILAMAFPNILGLFLLSGMVKNRLDQYMAKLRAGEFKTYG